MGVHGMKRRAHGIGLLSGGLDSALAARIVRDAGADVTCLHFATGFCINGHRSRVGRTGRPAGNPGLRVAAANDIRVELVDVAEEYLSMVLAPRHGYGANMNPCIDCRVLMRRRARTYMESVGADFVFTGEVLGQRPLSQRRRAIDLIERESGLEGRLLRPLSARLLPPTRVEEDGRVDRGRLLGLSGQGRRAQLALARRYELEGYQSPAGGCCLLADPGYSRRLRDLVKNRGASNVTMDDIYLLGVGRHFRLSPRVKVIVGRNHVENGYLDRFSSDGWSARLADDTGPTGITYGVPADRDVITTASIVARYGRARAEGAVCVELSRGGLSRKVNVMPAEEEWLKGVRI